MKVILKDPADVLAEAWFYPDQDDHMVARPIWMMRTATTGLDTISLHPPFFGLNFRANALSQPELVAVEVGVEPTSPL